MGSNDAAEQLRACQADAIRYEHEVADLRTERDALRGKITAWSDAAARSLVNDRAGDRATIAVLQRRLDLIAALAADPCTDTRPEILATALAITTDTASRLLRPPHAEPLPLLDETLPPPLDLGEGA